MRYSPVTFVLGFGLSSFVAWAAKADTVFLNEMPSSKITVLNAAKSTKPVYKCEQVKLGKNVNPTHVAGTDAVWVSDAGKGITNIGEALTSGKGLVRCKSMQLDNTSGRMKAAAL